MELRSIEDVNKYIKNANKLSDFLSVKLSKDIDINTYLHSREDVIDVYRNRYDEMKIHTLLHLATGTNNVNAINWVIKNGADVNKNMHIIYSKYIYDEAIRDYKLVPFLILEDISSLELAMKNNFLSIAQILIHNGADTSCLTEDDKKKLETSLSSLLKVNSKCTFYSNDNNSDNPFTPPRP